MMTTTMRMRMMRMMMMRRSMYRLREMSTGVTIFFVLVFDFYSHHITSHQTISSEISCFLYTKQHKKKKKKIMKTEKTNYSRKREGGERGEEYTSGCPRHSCGCPPCWPWRRWSPPQAARRTAARRAGAWRTGPRGWRARCPCGASDAWCWTTVTGSASCRGWCSCWGRSLRLWYVLGGGCAM